jgi:hypothetical protein
MESFAKEKSFQFLQSLQWDSGKPDFVQEMSRQLRMQNQWRLESEMAYLASYNHHCGQRLPKALQSSFSSIVTESCASSLYSVHEAYQVIHSWRPFSTVWSSSSAHSCLQALRRRRRRHRQSANHKKEIYSSSALGNAFVKLRSKFFRRNTTSS